MPLTFTSKPPSPRLDARLGVRTDEDAIGPGTGDIAAGGGDGPIADRWDAQAQPEAAAGLPALAHAHVLQGCDVQVAADIRRHAVAFYRRPVEGEVAAAGDVHRIAARDLGGVVGGLVLVVAALAVLHAQLDAEASLRASAEGHSHAAAMARVLAHGHACVLAGLQEDVVIRRQVDGVASPRWWNPRMDVGVGACAGGHDVDIVGTSHAGAHGRRVGRDTGALAGVAARGHAHAIAQHTHVAQVGQAGAAAAQSASERAARAVGLLARHGYVQRAQDLHAAVTTGVIQRCARCS